MQPSTAKLELPVQGVERRMFQLLYFTGVVVLEFTSICAPKVPNPIPAFDFHGYEAARLGEKADHAGLFSFRARLPRSGWQVQEPVGDGHHDARSSGA